MRLDDRLKSVNTISILGVEVKALSSLEFIDSILMEAPEKPNQFHTDYRFTSSKILEDGSYVFYLRTKLQPLQGQPVTITQKSQITENIDIANYLKELLLSRGKNPESISNNLIIKSGFVRQSAQKKYLPLFVATFFDSSYMDLGKTINKEGNIYYRCPENKIIHLLTSGDEVLWLLLGEELKDFVKLATTDNLKAGIHYVEKFYISKRRYVLPARIMLKIPHLNYSSSLPFGSCPEFPDYQTAIAEITKRLNNLDIPNLKFHFTKETVKS